MFAKRVLVWIGEKIYTVVTVTVFRSLDNSMIALERDPLLRILVVTCVASRAWSSEVTVVGRSFVMLKVSRCHLS